MGPILELLETRVNVNVKLSVVVVVRVIRFLIYYVGREKARSFFRNHELDAREFCQAAPLAPLDNFRPLANFLFNLIQEFTNEWQASRFVCL